MTAASLSSSVTHGARVTFAVLVSRFALQLVSLAILARLLSPDDFGLVAMVTAVLGVAEIVRDFGLSSAAIQAKEVTSAQRTNLFWVNVGIGASCALIACLLAPLLASLYGYPELVPITFALAGLFVVSGINTQFRAELSRSLRFSSLARTDIAAQIISATAAILAGLAGAGPWAIVLQQIAFVVTTCVANVLSCNWRPGLPKRKTPLSKFFKFGGALLGMQLMGYTTNNVDNVALGAVYGPAEVGLYSRAYQLLMAPLSQVANALLRVALPILSRLQDEDEVFVRYANRAQLLCSYSFGVAFSVVAGFAGPIVHILFGPGWDGVGPIFAVLAIGGIFRGMAQTTYWVCLAKDLTASQLRFYLLARPLMIGLILCGLPWGAVGVAIGHTAAFAVEWGASLWWVGRSGRIAVGPLFRTSIRSLTVACVPVVIIGTACSLMISSSLIAMLIGLVAIVVYFGLLVLVSPKDRTNARQVWVFARRMGRRRAMTSM